MAKKATPSVLKGPLTIERDAVEALTVPLEPFQIYRLDFEARTAFSGYWYADFYNAAGEKNYADNYSGIDPAADWVPRSALFMARAESVTGKLGFRVIKDPLQVRKIGVAPVSKSDALSWMDTLYAALPPVRPKLTTDRWNRLGQTRKALQSGNTLRVVALGDSISNDMMNGLGHLLVERACPGTTIFPIHANGPEKSCANYQRDEVLQRLVIRHRPELFTVSGMSHEDDLDAIRKVISKVRAACNQVETVYINVRVDGDPQREQRLALLAKLNRMADEDGFAVWDMTTSFEDCMRRSSQPRDWYCRDHEHVNDRGKQLLGRLYAAYFTP